MYFLAHSIVDSISAETSQAIAWVIGVFLLAISWHLGLDFALSVVHCISLFALQAGIGLNVSGFAMGRKYSAESLDGDEVPGVAVLAACGQGSSAVGIAELADSVSR